MTVGTRAQVWHGTADRTPGGLKKSDLFMKNGRIKSRRASRSAKTNKNLKKAGWTFKKGEFGAVRIDGKDEGKKRTARRSAKRSAKRSARRSAKRSARRAARRSARLSVLRVARRSARRSARRATRKSRSKRK